MAYVELSPSAGSPTAAGVTFTPAGNVAATNVQAAIAELDTEKVAKAGDTMTGNLVLPSTGSQTDASLNFGTAGTGAFGGASYLVLTVGGTSRLSIDTTAITSYLRLALPAGLASNASLNFGGNTTGLYGSTTNINFSVLGSMKFGIAQTGITALVPIALPADPTAALEAATKQYVDNRAVRYDAAQGLTAAQQSQARANIDVTKKNYIINGAMQISQENGMTGLSVSGQYPADMFVYNAAGTSGVVSYGQLGVITGTNANRISFTVGTVDTTVNAGDVVIISQNIEGLRCVDLKLGSSNAKTVTLQFGVRAPAGTYCVAFRNGAYNRCYISEYTITAGEANTDTVKSVTVALDTAGTWANDNTACLAISWALMTGSTSQTAANVWTTGAFVSTANQFNFMGTINNVFQLFDVSLTEGSVAPPFVVPDYASELAACQRYFEPFASTGGHSGWSPTTTLGRTDIQFRTQKRAAPTMVLGGLTGVVQNTSVNAPITGATMNNSSIYHAYVDFSVASGLVAAQPCSIGVTGLYFSARL